jgi:hypothetical protein
LAAARSFCNSNDWEVSEDTRKNACFDLELARDRGEPDVLASLSGLLRPLPVPTAGNPIH